MEYMLTIDGRPDGNTEVHKFYGGTVAATALLALVLQAFLHKYGSWSELVDLPLLVTIYFGVSRRNAVSGLLLGAIISIAQDALSHDNPIGMYGIAKTLVGYIASSVGARIDTDHAFARFALVFSLFYFHQGVVVIIERVLLNRPAAFFSVRLLIGSVVSALFSVGLFAILDKLRRNS